MKKEYLDLLNFHFNSLQGTYFSKHIKNSKYDLLYSNLIEDSYYNYASLLKPINLDSLKEIENFFIEKNRTPAIYITNDSLLLNNVGNNLYNLWAIDSWMQLENDYYLLNYKVPDNIKIEFVSSENKNEYIKIFNRAYGSDDPDDPYGQLPNYYGESLLNSFSVESNEFNRIFIWAKINEKPVGIASMFWNSSIAGIYGVGTIEPKRNIGVGTSMMKFLVKYAQNKKINNIMHQTESNSYVEKWYTNMGYKTIFLRKYFVKK